MKLISDSKFNSSLINLSAGGAKTLKTETSMHRVYNEKIGMEFSFGNGFEMIWKHGSGCGSSKCDSSGQFQGRAWGSGGAKSDQSEWRQSDAKCEVRQCQCQYWWRNESVDL